jgi:hypothetical protein
MAEEINKSTCRVCGEIKTRIQAGEFDSKNKRWIDETGKQWNGRKCPDCVVQIQKEKQRERRAKAKKRLEELFS